ncbi:MAG: class A beta-lactamase-related serine hydrolase [Elusimicrobia bacterium]|nr:class A beta-lactamase-related serine hydrolase [Elusimicrobiota bacterium]
MSAKNSGPPSAGSSAPSGPARRTCTISRLLPAAAAFFVGATAGYFLRNAVTVVPVLQSLRQPKRFRYTSPLLDCSTFNPVLRRIGPYQNALTAAVNEAKERGEATHVSVYFRDLVNGPWFGIDEKETFVPASLLRVPLLMSALKWAESAPAVLDQEVAIPSAPPLRRSPLAAAQTVRPGGTYTLRRLLERMIVDSDDYATVALLKVIPANRVNLVYSELGLRPPEEQLMDDFLRVKDYATFFLTLYNASYLTPKSSEAALDLLARTDFKLGLAAGVPNTVAVAHRHGERELADGRKQFHDCGIVYTANPYLLCVMTRGQDLTKLVDVVTRVSRICYEQGRDTSAGSP